MTTSYWSKLTDARWSRRTVLSYTSGLAGAAAVLAACGSGKNSVGGGGSGPGGSNLVVQPVDTTKQAKRTGVIKDRTFGDPPTLDIFTANNPLNAVNPHSYSSLVQFKAGYLKPSENQVVGDVGESWEWSPDGLQVTMKIRPNVKFHNKPPVNGRALDMDDILFSWNRFATKSSGRTGVVTAANPQAPVLSLSATDPQTIVIKLKEPLVYTLNLFASNSSNGVLVLPKETDSTFDIRGDMIGTGPYVMTSYKPSVGFTFKRHPDYWDQDYALAEQIELPIVGEYAAAVSQLKAGNIYSMGSYNSTPGVVPEDILPTKSAESRLLIYQSDLASPTGLGGTGVLSFGWLPTGKSPFLDERVRQALSMSWDRDLYLDTFFNVSKFKDQGLPVLTRWNSALVATYEGWWLDPKGKDFGPNAKYFQHDLAEAKKLLTAAGYPNGIQDVNSNYVTGPELGPQPKLAEIIDGMIREAGITSKVKSIDYATEYIPLYRDGHGQYEGWAYMSASTATGNDAVGALATEFWSKGASFAGFSTSGQNDQSGDPQVNGMIEKARTEQDVEKRRSLVFDIQRYLGKALYQLQPPGPGTSFTMAWPCLGNFLVYHGARLNDHIWVDDTKAPFKSA